MTTENNMPDGEAVEIQESNASEMTLEQAKAEIEKLRGIKNEAFKERDTYKSRVKAIDEEQRQREEALLAEQGQFKQLYEQAQAEVSNLKSGLKNKAVDAALKEALQKAGARSVDTVSKLIDKSKVEVVGDDFQVNTDSIQAQIEELRKTDPVLFGVGESTPLPSVKRPSDGTPSVGFETEMRAAKSQSEIMSVMKKYGKI